jgi:hypothetical protein
VTEWTCAWVLAEERERQGEEVRVMRQIVALPLPSSPTMEAPYKDSSIFRTCLHSPFFVQIKRSDFTGGPAFVRVVKRETGLFVFLRRARESAFLGSAISCQRCVSLSACISLLLQRAIPNLGGACRPLRDLSFVPLKWGSDAAISGRHVVSPLADQQEFRCCNVWSTSDLSCGHLSKNRGNGAPAFGAPTASR